MVKTTKDPDHSAAPPSGAGSEITVTNLYRNQPIVFHYLGGSVRLGPLESRQIGRVGLASPELVHFRSIGAVSVREAAAAPASSLDERRPQAAATPKER